VPLYVVNANKSNPVFALMGTMQLSGLPLHPGEPEVRFAIVAAPPLTLIEID